MESYRNRVEHEYMLEGIWSSPPEKEYKYAAYKKGTVTICDTREEAALLSKNVEKICTNQEEVDKYWSQVRECERRAYDKWYCDLREEWCGLDYRVFELCYGYSYREHHSYGYDEVANGMYDIIEFAKSILQVGRGVST